MELLTHQVHALEQERDECKRSMIELSSCMLKNERGRHALRGRHTPKGTERGGVGESVRDGGGEVEWRTDVARRNRPDTNPESENDGISLAHGGKGGVVHKNTRRRKVARKEGFGIVGRVVKGEEGERVRRSVSSPPLGKETGKRQRALGNVLMRWIRLRYSAYLVDSVHLLSLRRGDPSREKVWYIHKLVYT